LPQYGHSSAEPKFPEEGGSVLIINQKKGREDLRDIPVVTIGIGILPGFAA